MIPVSRLKAPAINGLEEALSAYAEPTGDGDIVVQDTASSRYSIRDILRRHFGEYSESHAVPFHKERAVRAIMACGTGELGYTLSTCTECGTVTMHADSCGNRNCPSCGYPRQLKWIAERNEDLLEGVPYVHVVFTLPHELNALIYNNQKVLLNNLFSAVKKSVLDLCMEDHHLVPGLLMVLHTFSSDLSLHYHIHMLATAAGISPDKSSFASFGNDGYFLPVRKLSMRYRGNFLEGLKGLREAGKLEFAGNAASLKNIYEWSELLDTCYGTEWNVEIRKYQVYHKGSDKSESGLTAADFPEYVLHQPVSPEAIHQETVREIPESIVNQTQPDAGVVTEYVSQYAFRTAISDNRIRSYDDETVTFDHKRYHDGECIREPMTLKTDEFIRRFLLHILDPGFQRIRYAGFLASCIREKTLSVIRELLGLEEKKDFLKDMHLAELAERFTGINPTACPVCKGKTEINARRVKILNLAARFINTCYIRGS